MESSDKIRQSVSTIRANLNKELDKFSELMISRMESVEATSEIYPIGECHRHFLFF